MSEFKVRITGFGSSVPFNGELFLGVVAPDARLDESCLHSGSPSDGVWGDMLSSFHAEDLFSVRVDMHRHEATLQHNGQPLNCSFLGFRSKSFLLLTSTQLQRVPKLRLLMLPLQIRRASLHNLKACSRKEERRSTVIRIFAFAAR